MIPCRKSFTRRVAVQQRNRIIFDNRWGDNINRLIFTFFESTRMCVISSKKPSDLSVSIKNTYIRLHARKYATVTLSSILSYYLWIISLIIGYIHQDDMYHKSTSEIMAYLYEYNIMLSYNTSNIYSQWNQLYKKLRDYPVVWNKYSYNIKFFINQVFKNTVRI